MTEYHKIQTLFKRQKEKPCDIIVGEYTTPELQMLRGVTWHWEEKLDGTNVRVEYDRPALRFKGRTDRAQMPTLLLDRLNEIFVPAQLAEVFDAPTVFYGEGVGAGIQKGGGNYNPDGVDFVLFDVRIGGLWLKRPDVREIAHSLNVEKAADVGSGTLAEATQFVREGFPSSFGSFQAEGLVLRPRVELLDRRGQRIITKLKHKDFRNL